MAAGSNGRTRSRDRVIGDSTFYEDSQGSYRTTVPYRLAREAGLPVPDGDESVEYEWVVTTRNGKKLIELHPIDVD